VVLLLIAALQYALFAAISRAVNCLVTGDSCLRWAAVLLIGTVEEVTAWQDILRWGQHPAQKGQEEMQSAAGLHEIARKITLPLKRRGAESCHQNVRLRLGHRRSPGRATCPMTTLKGRISAPWAAWIGVTYSEVVLMKGTPQRVAIMRGHNLGPINRNRTAR